MIQLLTAFASLAFRPTTLKEPDIPLRSTLDQIKLHKESATRKELEEVLTCNRSRPKRRTSETLNAGPGMIPLSMYYAAVASLVFGVYCVLSAGLEGQRWITLGRSRTFTTFRRG